MQKPLVLFDFDGTLADTLPLLISCVETFAPEYGVRVPSEVEREGLRNRRPQEWLKDWGITWWKLPFIVRRARRELAKLHDEIRLHEGLPEVVRELTKAGHELAILTSNRETTVRYVLAKYGIDSCFSRVHAGVHIFGKHRVLRRIKKAHEGTVVFIGDETRDIEAAHRAGIPIVAVAWGYCATGILTRLHPDAIVDAPSALTSAVQKQTSVISSLRDERMDSLEFLSGHRCRAA